MWIEAGKFGRTGRLLSGLETLVMYFLYAAAAFCLWQERRNLRMWFLFLVATIGIVGLGVVVVNAGALYQNSLCVLDDANCYRSQRHLELLDRATHNLDEGLNIFFRRIKRRHQSHFRNLFIPDVEKIVLL